jgi:predicted AlkP superfamily pyrophosphatase or phosphodiesterase
VLFIGIDGCRPDALARARAPHLRALARGGAFSDQAQTGDVPLSGPGWSSLLTGVWRTKHGVRDNTFDGADFGPYPTFLNRLKRTRPDADVVSIVHWHPLHQYLIRGADLMVTAKSDRQVAEQAAEGLRDRSADAVFVHFDDVDEAGHAYGFSPGVSEYVRAVERTDAYVGRLLHALRARPTLAAEDWLILVSTDHGGSGKSHGHDVPEDRTTFLIVNGPSALSGPIEPPPTAVDVAATALTHLGIALDERWGLDGRPVGLKNPANGRR